MRSVSHRLARMHWMTTVFRFICTCAFLAPAFSGGNASQRCYSGNGVEKLVLVYKVFKDACPCEFTHLVNIMDPFVRLHICTGVLLAPQVVVAPASCVNRPGYKLPLIRIGSYNLNKPDGKDKEELMSVCQARVHSNFKGDPEEGDDIALLLLKTPATEHKPVPGIRSWEDCKDGPLNTYGWPTIAMDRTHSTILQVVQNLAYVEREKCEKVFNKLPGHVICAEMTPGQGIPWDLGSALLCNDRDLVGLMAHTILEPSKHRPYVYLHMVDYVEWIEKLGRDESTLVTSDEAGCAEAIQKMDTIELNVGPEANKDDRTCSQEAASTNDQATRNQINREEEGEHPNLNPELKEDDSGSSHEAAPKGDRGEL